MSIFRIRGVLNEAYFGRTAGIKALVKQVAAFRNACGVFADGTGDTKINVMAMPTVNNNTELIKFNRMMEQEFGFKSFALQIQPSGEMNAYTIPIGIRWDVMNPGSSLALKAKNQGFKYAKEADYSVMVCVTAGVFYNTAITDAEFLALIIHEVGHNFQSALSGDMLTFDVVAKFIRAYQYVVLMCVAPITGAQLAFTDILTNNTLYQKLQNTLNDFMAKNPLGRIYRAGVAGTVGFFTMVLETLGDVLTPVTALLPISSLFRMMEQIPAMLANSILGGVRGEQFADSFAVMYGLGSELISALDKMEYSKNKLRPVRNFFTQTPVVGHFINIMNMPGSIITGLFESHPTNVERYKNELKYLENELDKNGLDPVMKKQIKDDIKKINRQFDKTYRTIKSSDAHAASKHLAAHSFDTSELGGFKQAMFGVQKNFDDIDAAADKAIKLDTNGNKIARGLKNVRFR